MAKNEYPKAKRTNQEPQDTIERLERIAQEWRAAFDSIPDFISIHDTNFNITRVNRAMAEALGTKPSRLIGKKCYEVIHGTDECWPDCPHRRTLETKQISKSEFFEPKLGLSLEVITSPIFNKRGEIVGSVHVARDVTWRKESEELLREEKELYREIADMLPQIVFEVDKNLRITFANRQALEIAGYTREDFEKGLKALDLLVPDYRPQAVYDIMIAMSKRESQQFEFTFRRKDGSTFPANVFMNPVIRGGKIAGLTGIVINLTEQKKLEQLKDDFLGMVSHELRTPLTSVIGSVNMVLGAGKRLTQKESRQLLHDAASAAEELSDTLSNLLELSRVRAERLILYQEPVNIKVAVKEVIRKFHSRTTTHRFILDLPKGGLTVPADHLRLEHILRNLLENAIKYSPNGGEIRVTVTKNENELVISVSDQGIGISKADQSKLFAPFQRLEELKTAGIGLGLLVCRRLVEAHHGRIWVESMPGQGSTFFFTIPLKNQ